MSTFEVTHKLVSDYAQFKETTKRDLEKAIPEGAGCAWTTNRNGVIYRHKGVVAHHGVNPGDLHVKNEDTGKISRAYIGPYGNITEIG